MHDVIPRTMPARSSDEFGVIHDARLSRHARLRVAWSIVTPWVGVLCIVAAWPLTAPTVWTAAVFAIFFIATALGIMLGLHRYFTHKSFKTSITVRALIATFASFAMQGPISVWVADHRRHHRFSDQPGDPHSPYWRGKQKITSRVAGFWHAHVLWLFDTGVTDIRRYAPDIADDPIAGWQSRHYWLITVFSLLLPAAVGAIAAGTAEALRCLLWAGCVRVAILHETTWAVNSFGHMLGDKEPGARDESRNNPWSFWLWFGEGLHSFHHTHPSIAVNEPSHLDPIGLLLLALER
jgi:stearoyl-CoA desaturase (delta-9 desaturase)